LSAAKSGQPNLRGRIPGFHFVQSGLRNFVAYAPRNDGDAALAILRRQSRHRQSPPSIGIGSFAVSSAHQQLPETSQENSVPQAEQARRRGAGFSDRFVMNPAGLCLRFSCRVHPERRYDPKSNMNAEYRRSDS
jgi:hypothetical protein